MARYFATACIGGTSYKGVEIERVMCVGPHCHISTIMDQEVHTEVPFPYWVCRTIPEGKDLCLLEDEIITEG